MKTVALLLCCLWGEILMGQPSNGPSNTTNLKIEVNNLRSRSGKLMFELRDANEQVVKRWVADIEGSSTAVELFGLMPGEYALRLFHDENGNGKLDTNMLGIPTEGYAFSNNVYGSFGPPAFERQLFDLKRDKRISVKMGY